MEFVEPYLLWGSLAVAIPIVIHFWHQKQGKPLPWAATQWLTEKDQQQSRGLRIDNIPLLILRCLLLLVLALLVSQLVLNKSDQTEAIKTVHLVQPSAFVTDNFRFELDEAAKKGEAVYLANNELTPIASQSNQPVATTPFNALLLQTAINELPTETTNLHLYVLNSESLADVPAITVPQRFHLHSVIDSTSQPRPYLTAKDGKKLFINQAGKLTATNAISGLATPGVKLASAPSYEGTLHVLLQYANAPERQTVRAALQALMDVYALDLTIDEKPTRRAYDWVLTDKPPARLTPKTLYIVSANEQVPHPANVIYTNEHLTPQTSDRVVNGQLPEWLGQQLIQQYELNAQPHSLSKQALANLFVPSTKRSTSQQASLQSILLLLFVSLLLAERWLALTKNA
ncbi:BatA domain-containing protein [Spirosoma sp. KUDC1026]|uniref:BatA domain-containing protein n=1 Tax=Spirosoma sp. KUDC1026 TaxID=2745947 RepID=UPI00159BA0CB|nr:BatA domain-containing protein [Spirosoma sp. KUDC1026]QKZ13603.1 BatA domain-containing protein [Spirosoma sp. KUDC1026]